MIVPSAELNPVVFVHPHQEIDAPDYRDIIRGFSNRILIPGSWSRS
jgi:hypothetical protein